MKLTYSHYSQEPLTLDSVAAWSRSDRSAAKQHGSPFKPVGLWLSVDGPDDWAEWCQSEQFGLDRYRYRQEVTLTGKPLRHLFDRQGHGGVLLIDDAHDLRCFTEIYQGDRSYSIMWERVMERYDGIVIAPYQWSCRMNLMWYYPWDVASGCIWNTDVIESIGEPVPVDWKERSDATPEAS